MASFLGVALSGSGNYSLLTVEDGTGSHRRAQNHIMTDRLWFAFVLLSSYENLSRQFINNAARKLRCSKG